MSNKNGTKELNLLIKKAIKEKDLTADIVKNNFETIFGGSASSGHLSDFLAGNRTAEISFLIGVYAALHCDASKTGLTRTELQKSFVKTDGNELKKWLVYWLKGILEQDMGRKPKRGNPFVYEDSYLKKWFEAIGELKSDFDEKKVCKSVLPTLDLFPDAFNPLTVITGTGLGIPPARISDLFRANASLTDLFFFNKLKLPKDTRIVADRLVIDMKPSERVKHFGDKHLLLIGGPKVNAVTREFGKYGIFRFQVPDEEKQFQNLYDSLTSEDQNNGLFPNPGCVEMFYESLSDPTKLAGDTKFEKLVKDESQRTKIHKKAMELMDKLGDRKNCKYKDIIKAFIPSHLIDPISGRRYPAKALNKEKDLTMITLAPNFFNEGTEKGSYGSYNSEFVSIIVAGLDRIGTAAGLRALARSGDFKEYPVGGFLEAEEGIGLDFERYSKSRCSWSDALTPSYTMEDFIGKVIKFKENPDEPTNKNSALQMISDEEGEDIKGLDNYLGFLEKFQTKQ